MYHLIFNTFTYFKLYFIPMAILYTRSYTLYSMIIYILHAPWPYPYSIPMAILYTRSYTSFPWLYFTLEFILYEISFINRLIIYTFTYYENYSISIVISILYNYSHNLFLWLYFILEVILYSHSHTSCSKLYSIDYALYIAQFCILKFIRYGIYFIKLASYIT